MRYQLELELLVEQSEGKMRATGNLPAPLLSCPAAAVSFATSGELSCPAAAVPGATSEGRDVSGLSVEGSTVFLFDFGFTELAKCVLASFVLILVKHEGSVLFADRAGEIDRILELEPT